ncbi:unnamed protein product [Prunus armeniaca]
MKYSSLKRHMAYITDLKNELYIYNACLVAPSHPPQNYRNMTPQNLMLLPLSTPKLSIGCPILDDCLGGGIPCNSIIEFVGESGFGKTQLCLQLTYQTTPADLKKRSEMFFNISGTLKGLAHKFGLAVVVTNQVVDFIGPHDGVNGVRLGNLESLDISGRRVSPALGLAWAHCIHSRVFLARHEQSIGVNIRNAPSTTICSETHRTFHLVFSPHLAHASAEFVIRKEGIVGVSR